MAESSVISRLFPEMDPSTGMFPEGWICLSCGKRLNADGNHPAELYAGTFNGLCYACTSAPGFVARVLPDGCQLWSYPPHCPSWRRDRERAYGYPDCGTCKGSGRISHGSWTSPPRHCDDCFDRHFKRGQYDTRSFFSRGIPRAEAERLTYIAEMGREPPEPVDDWQFNFRGTPRERAALRAQLQKTENAEQD
jgi:hypothetical protein